MSEILTPSDFGALKFVPVPEPVNQPNVPNLNQIVQILDDIFCLKSKRQQFGQKLDHFIYINFFYLKWSRLDFYPKSEPNSLDFGQEITSKIRTTRLSQFWRSTVYEILSGSLSFSGNCVFWWAVRMCTAAWPRSCCRRTQTWSLPGWWLKPWIQFCWRHRNSLIWETDWRSWIALIWVERNCILYSSRLKM